MRLGSKGADEGPAEKKLVCERERLLPPRVQRRGGAARVRVSSTGRQRCSARAGACVCSGRGEVCLQQYMTMSFVAAQYGAVQRCTCAVRPASITNDHSTCNTVVFTAPWRRGSPWWRRRPRLTTHARCRERNRATAQGQGFPIVALLAVGPEGCSCLHPSRGRA